MKPIKIVALISAILTIFAFICIIAVILYASFSLHWSVGLFAIDFITMAIIVIIKDINKQNPKENDNKSE